MYPKVQHRLYCMLAHKALASLFHGQPARLATAKSLLMKCSTTLYLMSFAILYKEAATVLRAPLISTTASCAARASNLFGAVTNGNPVSLATAAARAVSKPCFEFSPAQRRWQICLDWSSLPNNLTCHRGDWLRCQTYSVSNIFRVSKNCTPLSL